MSLNVSIKDFWSYIDDASTDKDAVLLWAKPDGGVGYSLRNMTKEQFFNIASTMAIKFNHFNYEDMIVIDEDSDPSQPVSIRYLSNANYMYLRNLGGLIFTAENTTDQMIFLRVNTTVSSLQLGGVSGLIGNRSGRIDLLDINGNGVSLSCDLTNEDESLILEIKEPRNTVEGPEVSRTVAFREDYQYISYIDPSNAENCAAVDARESVVVVKLVSPVSGVTLTFPSAPQEGDRCTFAVSGGGTTTITMATPGSSTIDDAITGTPSRETGTWAWNIFDEVWYRIA